MGVCTVPEESKAEESKSEKLEAGLLLCEWATVVVVVAFFFFAAERGRSSWSRVAAVGG